MARPLFALRVHSQRSKRAGGHDASDEHQATLRCPGGSRSQSVIPVVLAFTLGGQNRDHFDQAPQGRAWSKSAWAAQGGIHGCVHGCVEGPAAV